MRVNRIDVMPATIDRRTLGFVPREYLSAEIDWSQPRIFDSVDGFDPIGRRPTGEDLVGAAHRGNLAFRGD